MFNYREIYYDGDPNKVISSCKNKIIVMCSLLGTLDDNKKIILTLQLYEYVVASQWEKVADVQDTDGIISVDPVKVIYSYPRDMQDNIRNLIIARRYVLKFPETDEAKERWSKLWETDSMRKILEYHGFI